MCRTWIISQKLADEKEKDKKNVFVCTYNPETQVSNCRLKLRFSCEFPNMKIFFIMYCFLQDVRFEKYLPLRNGDVTVPAN